MSNILKFFRREVNDNFVTSLTITHSEQQQQRWEWKKLLTNDLLGNYLNSREIKHQKLCQDVQQRVQYSKAKR